jgi:hypothetical protein
MGLRRTWRGFNHRAKIVAASLLGSTWLDPAIQPVRRTLQGVMDARVKAHA